MCDLSKQPFRCLLALLPVSSSLKSEEVEKILFEKGRKKQRGRDDKVFFITLNYMEMKGHTFNTQLA